MLKFLVSTTTRSNWRTGSHVGRGRKKTGNISSFAPEGFGTLDELMEVMTLVQTKKVTKPLPIVLYGSSYWKKVLNFDAMIRFKVISKEDMKLFRFIDTVDEAFEYLKKELTRIHFR